MEFMFVYSGMDLGYLSMASASSFTYLFMYLFMYVLIYLLIHLFIFRLVMDILIGHFVT